MNVRPWYVVMRTDKDPVDGFYVPAWDDGGRCGFTPAKAMEYAEAEVGHVYLMWHIDNREMPPNFDMSEYEARGFLLLDEARVVITSDHGRIIMVDDCHKDELRHEKLGEIVK